MLSCSRSWKNHLRSVEKENQLAIYQTLCILIHEVDRSQFITHMNQFISYWSSKEPEFIKCYYKDRAGKETIQVYNANFNYMYSLDREMG